MSQINTNGINTNYPVPGTNNSSQGFRDNFAQIRNNLNTAATEITDLQNKAVLKAALDNSVLNNDMANTLISNASTKGFRATTYNLGNALSGTVLVDVNRADVQYGSVVGDVQFQFGGWAPTNTESNVVLRLSVANNQANISLPSQCVSANNNFGVVLLENYANISNTATLTAPANTSILEYTFSTIDCGNTISVEPINRPFQTTQVITRDPPSTGIQGDKNGTVAVSTAIGQVEATVTANTPTVITANTFTSTSSTISGTTLTIGTLSTGTIAPGMLLSGTGVTANTYILTNISGTGSGSTWTVSQSQTVASTAINGSTGIVGTTLTVGVETSGTVQEGMILSGSGVTANTWNHVAVVREGTGTNQTKIYVNGVVGLTYTDATNYGTMNTAARIGGGLSNVNWFFGNISNLRIVKGTAVYTANFTPPTTPLTAISGTSLLLNFTNAGIFDNAAENDMETVGNAQISTSVKKYGTGSLAFDGTGDWLLVPDEVNLRMGTNKFTVEAWVYLSATGSARGLVGKGTSTTGWLLSTNSSDQVVFTYGSTTLTSSSALSASTWTHVAVVREGTGTNQTKIYIGGSLVATGTVATDFNQTNPMYIGADRTGGSALNGYIDDLRITKGFARYTSAFTTFVSAISISSLR